MERKIEVERTLIIGSARVSECVYAFVRFSVDKECDGWIYGKCTQLSSDLAYFKTNMNVEFSFFPEEIVEINDSPDLSPKEINLLYDGEIVYKEIKGGDDV